MKTVFAASCVAVALMANAASAANVLEVVANTTAVLNGQFDPLPGTGGLAPGDVVDVANLSTYGLKLFEDAEVTFTYLGSEAGNLNILLGTAQIFSSATGALNSAQTLSMSADAGGFLPFSFTSAGAPVATNGGAYAANTSLAFKILDRISNDTLDYVKVLVLLNDPGSGDADYDDMVLQIEATARKGDVVATPIPGGVMLLMSGLAGLGYMGRARRSKKT
jgi:hypothetical protein